MTITPESIQHLAYEPTKLERFLGIQDGRLTNTRLVSEIAREIGQPDLADDLKSVGEQRINIRALDIVAQLSGLAAIACVATSKVESLSHLPPILLVGAGLYALQILLRQEIGVRSTNNDNTVATALSGISTTIKELKIGHIGDDASLAAERATSTSPEERFIYGRPAEMNLGEALSWIILTLSSDNKLATFGVGAINTLLSYTQTWLVNSYFARKNTAYQNASHKYIKHLHDRIARVQYVKTKFEKSNATRPINSISTGLGALVILLGKLPINTMTAGLMAKAAGFFTGVATRSININEAKERHTILNHSMLTLSEELHSFIKSPEAFRRHIKNSRAF